MKRRIVISLSVYSLLVFSVSRNKEADCLLSSRGTSGYDPVPKESMEMLYQNDSDYLFDSSKFDKTFAFKTTKYEEGIQQTAESYTSK